MDHSGGLAALIVAPYSRGFSARIFPPASPFPFLHRPRSMAAPHSCLVGSCGGVFPSVAPAGPHTPLYRSRNAILRAPWRCHQRLPSPLQPLHGHPVLLRLRYRQILCALAAPPLTCVITLFLAFPLAALSPISVAAYLVMAPSSALFLCRLPLPCGRCPPPRLHLFVQPSCCVSVPPSLSGASPPFLPRSPVAIRPALRAPSSGPGRRYFP